MCVTVVVVVVVDLFTSLSVYSASSPKMKFVLFLLQCCYEYTWSERILTYKFPTFIQIHRMLMHTDNCLTLNYILLCALAFKSKQQATNTVNNISLEYTLIGCTHGSSSISNSEYLKFKLFRLRVQKRKKMILRCSSNCT